MNQKEFVKQSILSASAEGLTGNAMVDRAIEFVFNGLVDGTCPYGKITSEMTIEAKVKEAKAYASPVVKNYIKKDKDLNGGVKYTPTNPRGPRQSKELKELSLVLDALIALPASDENAQLIRDTEALINGLKAETEKKKEVMSLEDIQAVLAKYTTPANEEQVG